MNLQTSRKLQEVWKFKYTNIQNQNKNKRIMKESIVRIPELMTSGQ
jgi:hypothetical protein